MVYSEIPPGACPELRRRGQDDIGVLLGHAALWTAMVYSEIPPGACPELRRRGQDDMDIHCKKRRSAVSW
jgi:hypothetical protein